MTPEPQGADAPYTEREVRFAGPRTGELRGLLFAAERAERGPAVLVVPDALGLDARALRLARPLAAAGHAVLLPDLAPLGAAGAADEPNVRELAALPDRPALAALEAGLAHLAARADVDPRRIAAVGFGAGGTLAFLLACTSTRLAAVVDVAGGPLRAELSAAQPIQPLELALNLDRPLLALFGAADPAVPAAHVALLRETLAAAAKEFEVVVLPEARGGFFHADHPHYHGAAFEEAWRRLLGFLAAVL